MKTLLHALAVGSVAAHGAMTFPKPRNSIDGAVGPWSDWAFPCDATHQGPHCRIHFCYDGKTCAGACPISAHNGEMGALNASNGQACYWFSNGCAVGCEKCDGTQSHIGHGHQSFLYNGMNSAMLRAHNITIDPWFPPQGVMELDRSSTAGLDIKPNCDEPTRHPSICDTRLRTANSQAECGSADDIYYWSPWRAPGAAPVIDACGTAGGRFPGQGAGKAGAIFQNSSVASQGDLGSHLPQMAPQATWRAGGTAEVGWTVMANHGGGYAYRLAPADGPLTEAVFQRTPLDFVGLAGLRWDGNVSSTLYFNAKAKGWQTDVGTTPAGSQWRKNPVPTILWEREGPSFEPVCEETDECRRFATEYRSKPGACKCSGHSNQGPLHPNLEIVDKVQIPPTLAPGRYVLQWRWDCEESDQIWTSCADVAIEA